MDDEPDLIVELIDLYLEDVPRRFEVMRSAFAGNDYSDIKRQAHTLKGSSSNLGALELARICDQIELLEINAPESGLPLLIAQVEQEFSRVKVIFLEERERRLA
jgi:HPt (histidine-containing phosphotransfer) domain-containing protein